MRRIIITTLCALFLFACGPKEKENNHVYVIAKTPDATKLVNKVVEQNNWQTTKEIKDAKQVLVVIQTDAANPLDPKFPTIHDLEVSADNKIDRSSMSFVIYTYAVDEKGQPLLVNKTIQINDPTKNYQP
ncbi:MAG: hypothetical protein AB7I18_01620 [Candidatus Berkiella sp.]